MPSIRRELENTPTAQWHARGAQRSTAWADRMRDYAALRSVLADHAAKTAAAAGPRCQPAAVLPGLLKLVAERAHYAGAEPVYRRYRDKQSGQQIIRWAGADSAAKPTPAFLAEAKIVGFWPYRDDVIKVADEFDMPPAEWAETYLRALADWAADDRPLAAYRPAAAPACVREDMAVLAAAHAQQDFEPSAAGPAERLAALADGVVRAVLEAGTTPAAACDAVRAEVGRLLAPPPAVLTARVLAAVAELSDRLTGAADEDTVVPPDQARLLRGMLTSLAALLADSTSPAPVTAAAG
jgi:hypothetical protein